MILLVKAYRLLISPLLPNTCRFEPSCSQYMIDALVHYGFFKGAAKGLWRILRCNPFGGFGYDPAERVEKNG